MLPGVAGSWLAVNLARHLDRRAFQIAAVALAVDAARPRALLVEGQRGERRPPRNPRARRPQPIAAQNQLRPVPVPAQLLALRQSAAMGRGRAHRRRLLHAGAAESCHVLRFPRVHPAGRPVPRRRLPRVQPRQRLGPVGMVPRRRPPPGRLFLHGRPAAKGRRSLALAGPRPPRPARQGRPHVLARHHPMGPVRAAARPARRLPHQPPPVHQPSSPAPTGFTWFPT